MGSIDPNLPGARPLDDPPNSTDPVNPMRPDQPDDDPARPPGEPALPSGPDRGSPADASPSPGQPRAVDPDSPGDDEANAERGATPRAGSGDGRRGFRAQFGAARGAAVRLVSAHVDLARTELSEIAGAIGRVAALLGAAFGLVLFAATLLTVGGSLFFGEWLFGSMGWGVLHFTELSLAVALGCVVVAIDVPPQRFRNPTLISLVGGVLVAVIAGLYLFNRLWDQLGATFAPDLDPATSPLVVGIAVGAALGAAIGLLGGARSNRGGSVGRVIMGAIAWALLGAAVGALVGAFSSITFRWRVAIAMGLATALGSWIALVAADVARSGIDAETFGRKFYPSQTIEATKETIEWVRKRTPLGPKS